MDNSLRKTYWSSAGATQQLLTVRVFPLALIFRRISSEHISFSFLVTPPVPLAVASKHDGAISPPVLPGFWKEWIMNSKGK